MIGLDPCFYGTHSLRRTKATLIYKITGNLRAVQLLLGHTKVESTVRYLGIEIDDALAVAEQIDVWKVRQSRHALPPSLHPLSANSGQRPDDIPRLDKIRALTLRARTRPCTHKGTS